MLGKRKSAEVVDFTLLEKVRKKNRRLHSTEPAAVNSSAPSAPSVGGFLDFTSPAPQSAHTGTEASTFGFLSDFAQASGAPDVTSKLSNPDAEVNALKLKIDDLEYKLDRLLERLSEMETKVSRD